MQNCANYVLSPSYPTMMMTGDSCITMPTTDGVKNASSPGVVDAQTVMAEIG